MRTGKLAYVIALAGGGAKDVTSRCHPKMGSCELYGRDVPFLEEESCRVKVQGPTLSRSLLLPHVLPCVATAGCEAVLGGPLLHCLREHAAVWPVPFAAGRTVRVVGDCEQLWITR